MEQVICKHCQGVNTPNDQFCGHCGQPLRGSTLPKHNRPPISKFAIVSVGLWGAALLVFLIAGSIWFWEERSFANAAAQSPPTLSFEIPQDEN